MIALEADHERGGQFAILPAGDSPRRSDAISEAAVSAAFAGLRALPYEVILMDSAPLLAAADAGLLVRAADRVIVIAQADRLSKKDALTLRETLLRLGVARARLGRH